MSKRKFTGNKPGDDFEKCGDFNGWEVFKRRIENLINLKVFYDGKYLGKANYWLSYSVNHGVFLKSKPLEQMQKNIPDVFKYVSEIMREEIEV